MIFEYIEGVEEIVNNFARLQNTMAADLVRGLKKAGNHLLEVSKDRVPVEYGELKDSGVVEVEDKGLDSTVSVGYTAPYALYVHEKIQMKLQGQPRKSGIGVYWGPHGSAKFLETPAREMGQELLDIIADEMRME